MKLALKILLVILIVLLLSAGGVIFAGSRNLSREVSVPPHDLTEVAGDPAEGQRLATRYACTVCHGGDLAGSNLLEAMPMADLPAPNLSGARFSVEEIERAVRHGVGSDGRLLMIMPSAAYAGMSDEELLDIASYVRSIPGVERDLVERRVGPLGRVAAAMSPDEVVTGVAIDHEVAHPVATPTNDGAYLTAMCRFCHGSDLGGTMFTAEAPLWAPNLTPHETGIGGWDLVRFRAAVQEGVSEERGQLDPNHMPWTAFAVFTDAEMRTVWEYLSSLPPVDRPRPPE